MGQKDFFKELTAKSIDKTMYMPIEQTEWTSSVGGFTKGEKEGGFFFFFGLVIAKDSWGFSFNSPFNHLQVNQAKRNINSVSLSSLLTPKVLNFQTVVSFRMSPAWLLR